MVGLNATRAAMLCDRDVDVIRGAGPIGAVAAAMLDHYLDWQVKLYGHRGVRCTMRSRSRRCCGPSS